VHRSLEYKAGGRHLDSLRAEARAASSHEHSRSVGSSPWSGRAGIVTARAHPCDEGVLGVGADVHAVFDVLLLDMVVARHEPHEPSPKAANGVATMHYQAQTEVTWMAMAALFPTARKEWAGGRWEATTLQLRWLATLRATAVTRAVMFLRVAADVGAEPASAPAFRSVTAGFSATF